MTAHAFPFQAERPVVTLTLLPPDFRLTNVPSHRETFEVDTGFSDYLQLDWATFVALGLQYYATGTITSELADGSFVTDLLATVRVVIPECGTDRIMRCISNMAYGRDLLLVGNQFLTELQAVIDYPQGQTTLSD